MLLDEKTLRTSIEVVKECADALTGTEDPTELEELSECQDELDLLRRLTTQDETDCSPSIAATLLTATAQRLFDEAECTLEDHECDPVLLRYAADCYEAYSSVAGAAIELDRGSRIGS